MLDFITEKAVDFGQYGIAGLFFVMWWIERKDRKTASNDKHEFRRLAAAATDSNAQMIELVQSNTAAMVALKEQIHLLVRKD